MAASLRRGRALAAGIAALGLVAAACGDSDGTTTGDGGGSGSAGRIVISGSSTVEPISAAVAKLFNAQNPDVTIEVSGPGTGDGFARFCVGETDISNASRAIKQAEADVCADNGVRFVEILVGLDGLSVVTHPDSALECLTFPQLYALFGPEATGFDSWSDANALLADMGVTGEDLPDAPLTIAAPGEESGTYDFFVETIIEPKVEELVEAGDVAEGDLDVALREDYDPQANDNVIKQIVSGTPDSLGFFGAAFTDDSVKTLAVDGGDGCVAPEVATIADGSYPISRPLFIYVNIDNVTENPNLGTYVDLYLSEEGLATVTEVGYVRNAEADEAAEIQRYTDRTEGSRYAA